MRRGSIALSAANWSSGSRAIAVAPVRQSSLADLLATFEDEQLLGYLDARIETVTSLVAEVSAAVQTRVQAFAFLDLSGAEKGFATGHPMGDAAPTIGWQVGIDVASLAEVCDIVEATGYAADPDRLSFDLDAYHFLLADRLTTGPRASSHAPRLPIGQ